MGIWIKKTIRLFLCCGTAMAVLLAVLLMAEGLSMAAGRADTLREEVQRLDKAIQDVLDRIDQLARRSEEVSREVQALKSKGRLGMIDQVRMERLLSRLRAILLERRELHEVEVNLNSERKKEAGLLYDQLGEEIGRLLAEGEAAAQQGDARRADQTHKEVLARMQERQRLIQRRSPWIPVLPEVEIPDTEGISPDKQKEIAILLKNDAETLEKNKKGLLEERGRLQKELKIKRSLARFQGFPRGIEDKPIDLQIEALEEKLTLFGRAIHDHTETIRRLLKRSEEALESARREEAELLK
ncbi:MAG: hypothetical protein ACE5HN_02240 [Nitrospiria bacterium]